MGERDGEAIEAWAKERCPKEHGHRRRGELIVFQDESGSSLQPSARSTWAP